MKKYIFTSFFCLALVLGCNDILDQSNPNTLTPDNFWETEADATSAIIGAYSPLSTIFYHGRIWSGHEISRSDEIFFQADFASATSLFNTNPADANFLAAFSEMWKGIFRANLVLKNVPNIEMDSDLKNYILGEAYFLRALQYFTLVNHWGSVPLVTQPAETLEETQQPPSTEAEIWQQIKVDLNTAITLLPTSWDNNNKGRAIKGSAAALLGKSHLFLEEWNDAVIQFERIIDGELGTFDLVANYGDNFKASTENNIESLFEIQFDATGAWTAGWGADVQSTARYNSFEGDLSTRSASKMNTWVFELFTKETTLNGDIDPRAFETLVWDYPDAPYYNGRLFATVFADDIAAYEADPTLRMPLQNAKYVNLTGPIPAFNTSPNNKRVIRFANVLLMHAEAENEANGPTAEAYASINRVRARATMPEIPAGLSQADFRQRVRDERVLELCNESHRPLDLKRWGILASTFEAHPEYRPAIIQYQPGRELLPIPELELNTNPNWNEQNPGYN